MICSVIIGVCLSFGGPESSHIKMTPAEDAAAIVTLWNGNGPTDGITPSYATISMDGIEVTLTIHHTYNSRCKPDECPDTMEVIDITPGYIAIPSSITVDEDNTGEIVIYKYIGG